jgi:hypothetical protein
LNKRGCIRALLSLDRFDEGLAMKNSKAKQKEEQ